MEENVKLHNTVFYHPLFSCFITLYTLILIYLPNDSIRIFLSPVFLISVSLLLSLLRHGSTRESNTRESNTRPGNNKEVTVNANLEETQESKLDFVEWDLRAPLEVIHEAYEEEEEEQQEENLKEIERFSSLSLCYPESDSGSESDSSSEFNFPVIEKGISPEKMGFKWEEEGLIEIKLDKYYHWDQTEFDFHAEEDGLIEIDLFP